MMLVSLKMRGSVAINIIFVIKWRYYGPKGDILDYWGTLLFFNYPIISYQRINVYRVEAKDMGIFRWKMVPVENAILVSTKVLIVSDKILW